MTAKPVEIAPEVSRACPVCATADESTVYASENLGAQPLDSYAYASRKLPEYMHLRLMLCSRCDLIYADSIPATEDLESAYNEAAYDSGEEARCAAKTYVGLVNRLLPPSAPRKGALDIGAGDGAFLSELLSAGFTNVEGVEPSSAPLASAPPDIRPLIRQAMFTPEEFAGKQYALVTCLQTIEHVPEPLGLCKAAYDLLTPGGAMLIVGHNWRALSARVLGRKSPIFDVEHLQLFSAASLRRLLATSGYSDVKVVPVVNKYPLHYWFKLFPLPRAMKTRLLKWLKASRVGKVGVALPAGNIAAVGFKRDTVTH